jgi:hypothetical protein
MYDERIVSHMATVPISGTDIRFLSGVPFSNDYKHTRWFDTQSEQTTYFLNKPTVHVMGEANFQRIEGSHIIAVNKSIDELWGTNYVMFRNTHYNSKWFYAFVTNLEYRQRNTTYVHFQIDVFQTWKFDMDFKPSYVSREHRPLWNADGTPVVNTIPEGLNYGTEYDNVYTENVRAISSYKWLVIVTKTPIHDGVTANQVLSTVKGAPQPLSYYLIPFQNNNDVPVVYWGSTGDAVVSAPTDFLDTIYKTTDAVNNIVSLFITDYIGCGEDYEIDGNGNNSIRLNLPDSAIEMANLSDPDIAIALYIKNVEAFQKKELIIGDKYEHYDSVKESKLLMHPYCVTVLDDFRGNRTEYKTEYINNTNLVVSVKGSLGLSNKTSWGIKDYNNDVTSFASELNNESALMDNNPNDVPIMTDNLAAFLQGNRNSIQNQKQSILWNGTMNAIGSGVSGVGAALTRNPLGVASAGVDMVQGAGNTQLQLEGINAKQQDIGNIPPQISKMGSNSSYDFGNGYNGVFLIKKQIKPEYRKKLEDYFNMFGYKTNEIKIPNFHTRRYWNYVKTESCVILGNFNNEDLQDLKRVFDNGITFWHTDDVGNYTLNNEVL